MAKKKKGQRVPFTEEEIKYIMETPLRNLKDLAFMMRRDYDSLRRKKWALENKERDIAAKKDYKKKIANAINDGKRMYDYWSQYEKDLIVTSKLSDLELAKELNRSVGAIQVKRNRLLKEKKNGRRSKKIRRDDK